MTHLFDFKARPSAFAVMGNPVEHSKSPQIHGLFARQFDIDMVYDRIQVDVGGFDQAVSHFFARDGAGINITVPYKIKAWELCHRKGNSLSARASLARAVNTFKIRGGGAVYGDNTDGAGLVTDIQQNHRFSIGNSDILIVGAGGAVRGVFGPLLECRPNSITIANRTSDRAGRLAAMFDAAASQARVKVKSVPLDHRADDGYDLIINGTAAGLSGELPGINDRCIGEDTIVYDMMYGERPTVFMEWALSRGARKAYDGLGMLVEQAAESFFLWHDRRPETRSVIRAVRQNRYNGLQ